MARTQEVIVMDIGSSKIRLLVVEKPNNGILAVKQIVQIAHEGYYNGEWVDGNSTADAICQAVSRMRDNNVRVKRLYVSVPAEFCKVRTVNHEVCFPKRRKVERNDLVSMFVNANPFANDMTSVVVNRSSVYYVVEGNQKIVNPEGVPTTELRGFLSYIACQHRVVEFLDKVFARIGITDVHYCCGMYAEMMCLFDQPVRDHGLVLAVDAGYLSSTVALMRGDGIMHMRSFSCGKGVFVAWLQQALGIPFSAAEALFDKTDLSYSPREGDTYTVDVTMPDGSMQQMSYSMSRIQSYVSDCIAQFAANVQHAVDSFDEPRNITVGMYVFGGALAIRGAEECFGKKMNRYVKSASPMMCPQYKKPMYAGMVSIAHYAFAQEEKKRDRYWK